MDRIFAQAKSGGGGRSNYVEIEPEYEDIYNCVSTDFGKTWLVTYSRTKLSGYKFKEKKTAGQGGFNEDKAISYLKNNFILPYGAGQCINHMVPALIEGGITGLNGKPIKAACLYGSILKNLGFVTVNRTNTYYKGDIAIIQGYDGGKFCEGSGVVCGHIQMYDGKQWISDFPQSRPFWPGKGYADATPSPSFEILHWGGN